MHLAKLYLIIITAIHKNQIDSKRWTVEREIPKDTHSLQEMVMLQQTLTPCAWCVFECVWCWGCFCVNMTPQSRSGFNLC